MGGSFFETPPILPHGITGIFISPWAKFGKDVTIYENAVIIKSKEGSPRIGNECVIGANATVVGGVFIGNNVRIGAGCVVSTDVPSNATVVMQKPRVIIKDEYYKCDNRL